MVPITLPVSSPVLRTTVKAAVFVLASLAAIFCASAGLGLLRMLVSGLSSGAVTSLAELATHSGLTLLVLALAAGGAWIAKKSFW